MTENIEEKKSILPHFTESIRQKLNEKLAAAQGEDSGEEKRFPGASVAESIFQKLSEKRAAALNEDNREDKRSAGAVMAEKILRTVNDGHLSSVEKTVEFLHKRAAVEDEPLKIVKSRLSRDNGEVIDFLNIKIVCFGDHRTASHTVLYLHGGGYTEEVNPFHLNYCAKLAERIGALVLVPIYPLAPNHIWKETYDILTELYKVILKEKQGSVTIMGDSAGGGLAIAFCQYLKTVDLVQPDHLICLSPWVDVCMEDTDYEPYRPLDPMLDVAGLQTYGKAWAGDLDLRDPKISPTFGDNHGLPKTLLITGTRGIFYPDICKFYENMRKDGCDVELMVGEGMNHVYPIYGLPESKPAVARIDEVIQS